jgi:DNA polymerase (family X)
VDKEEIIQAFELTAQLTNLHEDNAFNARAYEQAAQNLEKYYGFFPTTTASDLESVISKAMSLKTIELRDGKTFTDLEQLLKITPQGILDILTVPGLGPKKVRALWNEHGIDTLDKLKGLIDSGGLAAIKGFGEKSADAIAKAVAFMGKQNGLLFFHAEEKTAELSVLFNKLVSAKKWAFVGQIALEMPVITYFEVLIATEDVEALEKELLLLPLEINEKESSPSYWSGTFAGLPLKIFHTSTTNFTGTALRLSATEGHLAKKGKDMNLLQASYLADKTEDAIYLSAGLPNIIPPMRNGLDEWEWATKYGNEPLVEDHLLKGILHNHSTYSDGKNTLAEMAQACIDKGYEYFGICDHSFAANFYANGMAEETVLKQWAEIDRLNATYKGFKIFKGIEADILNDGALDYNPEFLKGFDFVVASIHGNLKMDKTEATDRIIKAIYQPATTILGHSSGRLLLKREGYPLDYQAVFKAALDNQVVIELNAHPRRLDLDWTLVYKAMNAGILISINPDAHKVEELWLMKYGTKMARKAGLLSKNTLNAMSLQEIEAYFQARKTNKNLN